jgi:hypothetical protein
MTLKHIYTTLLKLKVMTDEMLQQDVSFYTALTIQAMPCLILLTDVPST